MCCEPMTFTRWYRLGSRRDGRTPARAAPSARPSSTGRPGRSPFQKGSLPGTPGAGDTYVGYAGTNGHAYTSIGRALVEDGKLPAERLSLPAVRASRLDVVEALKYE